MLVVLLCLVCKHEGKRARGLEPTLACARPCCVSASLDSSYPTCRMWELTGQAVFSWGSSSKPSLSCQARPQEGECFGEFPPRKELPAHTRFPVIVPSPTPSYNSHYSPTHLQTRALSPLSDDLAFCRPVSSPASQYCSLSLAFACFRRGYSEALHKHNSLYCFHSLPSADAPARFANRHSAPCCAAYAPVETLEPTSAT